MTLQRTPTSATHWSRRRLLAASAIGLTAPLVWSQAAFPNRPLTIIVPFTAGGSSDIGARMLATELSKLLGQPVVVDNVAGAGGAIGVQKLIRSPADGYTLLYGGLSESLLIPLINPAVNYKPEDMLPIAMVGSTPVVFVTRPDFPANSVDELIAMARKSPGKLSFGSAGIGSFAHVMAEVIKEKAGVFMVHIPYRGGAQILSDVISGQIDLGVTAVSNAASMIAGKRVKALGVSSRQRVSIIKDVPTFAESGSLKGLEMQVWGLMYTPLSTPAAVVTKLNTAINTAMDLPNIKTLLVKLGAELPSLLSPAQAQAFVQAEQKMYRPVVSRIKPE
jgi:tripartite-type tricarboxylate transporter receptor subunit TctC